MESLHNIHIKTTLDAFLAKSETQQWIQVRTQDTRFIPRFGHTTKVSYSPLRSPQRVRFFPTLILQNPTTKVNGFLISNVAHKSRDYKLLGVVHKFGESQVTSNCLET